MYFYHKFGKISVGDGEGGWITFSTRKNAHESISRHYLIYFLTPHTNQLILQNLMIKVVPQVNYMHLRVKFELINL